MRTVVGIALVLIGIGLLLGRVEGVTHESPHEVRDVNWVRTARGWERADNWLATPVSGPQLHPLVVAAGQGFVSLLALVACATERPVDLRRLWLMTRTGR